MRVLIREDPFVPDNAAKSWREEPVWPCSWIAYPDEEALPLVTAYRLRFPMDQTATVRVHVSADERYKLFLDGMQIGMGPERGDPFNWFYETYDLALSVGEHVIVAQVWSLGELAAMAQMSVHPGFLFAPEGPWAERLGSGRAPWEVKRISGYEFVDPAPARWREHRVRIDGSRYPWGWERGAGDGWQPARTIKRAIGRHVDWEIYKEHVLKPAMLPPMMAERRYVGTVRFVADVPSPETRAIPVQRAAHQPGEAEGWRALIHDERALLIPPHTCRRVIIDLDNYYCAYPELTVSGGAGGMVRVHWCEALHMTPDRKSVV